MDAASDILRDRQVLRVDSAAGISKGDEESEDEDGATGPESSHSDESGAVGEANASADSGHYSEDAGAGSEGENEGQEIGEKEGGKAPTSESHSQPVTRKKFGKTVHLEDNAADPEVDHEKFLFEETTNFAQFDANDQEAVWGRQEAIEKGVERVDWHGPSVSDVLEEVKLDVGVFYFFIFFLFFNVYGVRWFGITCLAFIVGCVFFARLKTVYFFCFKAVGVIGGSLVDLTKDYRRKIRVAVFCPNIHLIH